MSGFYLLLECETRRIRHQPLGAPPKLIRLILASISNNPLKLGVIVTAPANELVLKEITKEEFQ